MKASKLILTLVLLAVSISAAFASVQNILVDYDMRNHSIYNANDINASRFCTSSGCWTTSGQGINNWSITGSTYIYNNTGKLDFNTTAGDARYTLFSLFTSLNGSFTTTNGTVNTHTTQITNLQTDNTTQAALIVKLQTDNTTQAALIASLTTAVSGLATNDISINASAQAKASPGTCTGSNSTHINVTQNTTTGGVQCVAVLYNVTTGSGTGNVTTSVGTANVIPKYTTSSNIGNSSLTDSGTGLLSFNGAASGSSELTVRSTGAADSRVTSSYVTNSSQEYRQSIYDSSGTAGSVIMEIDAIPLGNNFSTFRIGRNVNTTGAVSFDFLRGDGSSTIQFHVGQHAADTSYLSNGSLAINTTTAKYALTVVGTISGNIDAGNLTSGTLIDARLNDSGVTPGSYGNGSYVSVPTFDQKGRATGATTVAIQIPMSQVNAWLPGNCTAAGAGYYGVGMYNNSSGYFQLCYPAITLVNSYTGISIVSNLNGTLNISGGGVSSAMDANTNYLVTSVNNTTINTSNSYFSSGHIVTPYGLSINTTNVSHSLDVNGTAYIYSSVDGAEILRLATDRGWSFVQVGTGSSTQLALRTTSDAKDFLIQSANNTTEYSFTLSNTGSSNVAKFIMNGGTTCFNCGTNAGHDTMEVNGGIIRSTGSGASQFIYAGVGGVLYDTLTQRNNSGTTESTLFNYSITASMFSTNKEKVTFYFEGNFSNSSHTPRFRAYVNTTSFCDTGSVSLTRTGPYRIEGSLTRSGSASLYAECKVMSGSLGSTFVDFKQLTGLTLSIAQDLNITVTSNATDSITGEMGGTQWLPVRT